MALGHMTKTLSVLSVTALKDADGFVTRTENTVATVRCYREGRHGSKFWANLAAFEKVTDLFRFRVIPGITVTTDHFLLCDGEKFSIFSVEDVRGMGMYLEVMAEKLPVSTIG